MDRRLRIVVAMASSLAALVVAALILGTYFKYAVAVASHQGSGMTSSCDAGAAAGDARAPGPGPPACSGNVQLTSPQQFSTSNDADSPSRFDTQCLYGGYVKGFSIAPAIAADPVNNRVFSVQGTCIDGSTTDSITLTTDDQCQSTYTAGAAKYVPSDSTPAAFWNTYYR